MSTSNSKPTDLVEQAAYWVDHYDPELDREAFHAWLRTSPEHVKELLVAARLAELTKSFDPDKRVDVQSLIKKAKFNVLPVAPHVTVGTRRDLKPIRKSRLTVTAVAACALAVVSATLGYYFFELARGNYATANGERSVVTLEDGSIVQINSDSRLQVRYSETARDIYLNEGQAAFNVRRDPARPFRVHAKSAVIQAVGTQFDVHLVSGRTLLAVVEGVVQVSVKAPLPVAPKVSAGEGTIIEADGKVAAVQRVDANAISDWHQRLKFLDTPLGEIAAAFNRYNLTPQIRIEGDALKKRQFSANFSAHRVESLLATLAYSGLTFERHQDEIVIRDF